MKKTFQKLLPCAALCVLLLCTPTSAAAAFSDVPADYWAADAITWAANQNLFRLSDGTIFGAGQAMTRGEFVSALCRLFGWETVTPDKGSFTDNQNPSAWYYSAVETAYANGAITQQTAAFRPEDTITREELTVMMVRSLGYQFIAGLTQSLPFSFQDVRTNLGYISTAYELGLMKGTSDTTFSPYAPATRAQCAVILQRLSAHLTDPHPEQIGIIGSPDLLTDLSAYHTIGVSAARLTTTNGKVQLAYPLGNQEFTLHDQVKAAGAKAFLYVTGSEDVFSDSITHLSTMLSSAVIGRNYDGLMLDLSKLPSGRKSAITQLVQSLERALGSLPLYVVAEAPSWQGGVQYDGYDYTALGAAADRLILRIIPYAKNVEDFPTAPLEPLEELYYTLSRVADTVPASRLSVWMTTTGNLWTNGKQGGAVRAQELDSLLEDPLTQTHYSSRYVCPYLTRNDETSSRVIWYLDADALQQRVKLLSFFGVGQICFSDLTSMSKTLLGAE